MTLDPPLMQVLTAHLADLVARVALIAAAGLLAALAVPDTRPAWRRGVLTLAMLTVLALTVRAAVAAMRGLGDAPPDGLLLLPIGGPSASLVRGMLLLVAFGSAAQLLVLAVIVVRRWLVVRSLPPFPRDGIVDIAGGIRVVADRDGVPPWCCEVGGPTIALPAAAVSWPAARLRMVVAHEREHLAQHDPSAQLMADLARALLWFHPGVHALGARLRLERELACDRAVLAQGVDPLSYAEALLAVARATRHQVPHPAFAARGALARRIEALTQADASRGIARRSGLARRALLIAAAGIGVLSCVVPLIGVQGTMYWSTTATRETPGTTPASYRPEHPTRRP